MNVDLDKVNKNKFMYIIIIFIFLGISIYLVFFLSYNYQEKYFGYLNENILEIDNLNNNDIEEILKRNNLFINDNKVSYQVLEIIGDNPYKIKLGVDYYDLNNLYFNVYFKDEKKNLFDFFKSVIGGN